MQKTKMILLYQEHFSSQMYRALGNLGFRERRNSNLFWRAVMHMNVTYSYFGNRLGTIDLGSAQLVL
jgi:hypothetical protein